MLLLLCVVPLNFLQGSHVKTTKSILTVALPLRQGSVMVDRPAGHDLPIKKSVRPTLWQKYLITQATQLFQSHKSRTLASKHPYLIQITRAASPEGHSDWQICVSDCIVTSFCDTLIDLCNIYIHTVYYNVQYACSIEQVYSAIEHRELNIYMLKDSYQQRARK